MPSFIKFCFFHFWQLITLYFAIFTTTSRTNFSQKTTIFNFLKTGQNNYGTQFKWVDFPHFDMAKFEKFEIYGIFRDFQTKF